MEIAHWDMQIAFKRRDSVQAVVKALIDDDLLWDFSVTQTADSAEQHIIEIHDMNWAGNMARLSGIVSAACGEKE